MDQKTDLPSTNQLTTIWLNEMKFRPSNLSTCWLTSWSSTYLYCWSNVLTYLCPYDQMSNLLAGWPTDFRANGWIEDLPVNLKKIRLSDLLMTSLSWQPIERMTWWPNDLETWRLTSWLYVLKIRLLTYRTSDYPTLCLAPKTKQTKLQI